MNNRTNERASITQKAIRKQRKKKKKQKKEKRSCNQSFAMEPRLCNPVISQHKRKYG